MLRIDQNIELVLIVKDGMTIRTGLAAFACSAIVSIVSGLYTGGVAAAYAFSTI